MASSISSRRGHAGWRAPRALTAPAALAVIAIVIAVGASRARADSPAASADPAARQTAQARLRLVEGVELLRKELFAAALAQFDQAYALVPSPNIHYDRGLAYVGLGRDADALDAFDAFLADADHAPPGTREKAERQRLTLRAHVATLEVSADLAGAQVTLDGRRRGATPLGRSLYLDPGLHEVSARNAATGAVATERVAAAPGQKLTVALRLSAPDARLAHAPRATARTGLPAAPAAAAQAKTKTETTTETVTDPATSETQTRTASDSRDRDAPPARSAVSQWSLAAATLSVTLLAAGGAFGLLAQHEANGLTDDSRNSPPAAPTPFDQDKEKNGLRYQTIEWVCLAGGAAALATGVVLYAVGRRNERLAANANASVSGAKPAPRANLASAFSAAPTITPTLTSTFTLAGAGLQLSF